MKPTLIGAPVACPEVAPPEVEAELDPLDPAVAPLVEVGLVEVWLVEAGLLLDEQAATSTTTPTAATADDSLPLEIIGFLPRRQDRVDRTVTLQAVVAYWSSW
jgi:hypothetical protein